MTPPADVTVTLPRQHAIMLYIMADLADRADVTDGAMTSDGLRLGRTAMQRLAEALWPDPGPDLLSLVTVPGYGILPGDVLADGSVVVSLTVTPGDTTAAATVLDPDGTRVRAVWDANADYTVQRRAR